MCEPDHSIVQFPENDDQGTPMMDRLGLGKIGGFFKRIGGFLHISRMGYGHSETWENIGLGVQRYAQVPPYCQFETDWVNRHVRWDAQPPRGSDIIPVDAMASAEEYADRVVLGSMASLRQFIAASIKATRQAGDYADRFAGMLTQEGRGLFWRQMGKAKLARWRGTLNSRRNDMQGDQGYDDKLTKVICGFTRKRSLLIPVWADNPKVWTPGQ